VLKSLSAFRQLFVFVAGGLLCAAIDVGVMQTMVMAAAPLVVATSAGFIAGLGVNFIFHSKVTFKRAGNISSLARYLCVVGINYILTLVCVYVAVQLGASPLTGKIVSLPMVAIDGFLLGKYWIYR
jgi:putative flippase GtrA